MFYIFGTYDFCGFDGDFCGTYAECVAELDRMANESATSRSRNRMSFVMGMGANGRPYAIGGGGYTYFIGTNEDDFCDSLG